MQGPNGHPDFRALRRDYPQKAPSGDVAEPSPAANDEIRHRGVRGLPCFFPMKGFGGRRSNIPGRGGIRGAAAL